MANHPSYEEIYDNIHDAPWRLRNLYKITNKEKKTITFKPNYVQNLLEKSPGQLEAVLKARQFGISTYYLLKKLDKTIFNENQTTCILAHEQDAIKKLFRIIRFAYDNLPEGIRPRLAKGGGSIYELYFPDINSRIYCDLESRGDTISNLHVSEYAFCKDPDKVRATMDAVPITTGEISIESTPNGMNHFYDEWNDSSWAFKKHFFPWYFHHEYKMEVTNPAPYTGEELELIEKAKNLYNVDITPEQIAFRRFKISQRPGKKGHDHFLQEYPEDDTSCFLMSGASAMDLNLIKKKRDNAPSPISDSDGLRVWETFTRGQLYVCGVDTAEGIGKDYSVATIYNARTRKQAAQLRVNRMKPGVFGSKVYDLCKLYTGHRTLWPLLGVERNNHGHAVILRLTDLSYPNLFEAEDGRSGWKTTSSTRPVLIDEFIEDVEADIMEIRDDDTLGECMTLVDNKGKIEAVEGKNDDCIIASAIANQMMKRSGAGFTDKMLTM